MKKRMSGCTRRMSMHRSVGEIGGRDEGYEEGREEEKEKEGCK